MVGFGSWWQTLLPIKKGKENSSCAPLGKGKRELPGKGW